MYKICVFPQNPSIRPPVPTVSDSTNNAGKGSPAVCASKLQQAKKAHLCRY